MIKIGTVEYISTTNVISTYLMVKVPLPNNYTSTFLVSNLKSYGVSVAVVYNSGN